MPHHLGNRAEYRNIFKSRSEKLENRLVTTNHTAIDLFHVETLTQLNTSPPIVAYATALLKPRPPM
jgi:hypothetical protein